MKTLVTGASGFIGSAVVRKLLGRGKEVRCYLEPGAPRANLDGLEVEILEGDVNDRSRIAEALKGCDTLYHLAAIYAIWLKQPERMYEVNVEGTKTVLWAAYKANLDKVVYTSSIAAVGRREDGRPADETVPFSPSDWADGNGYIRSKWLSDRDALRFAREGLPLVVVNPAFPFGERDIAPTPTGGFIIGAIRGKVPGYMDGGFCAVDVEDVAEGHVLAAEKGRVGERYILGNHNVSWKDFLTLAAKVAGVKPPSLHFPRWLAMGTGWAMEKYSTKIAHRRPLATYKSMVYTAQNLYFDNTKARRELGLPSTPLEDSLQRSVRWFREHGYA
ncbi:MAG: NAD-dependent epimerase/dehydratase family protein [Myxococcales bacterium]|nr:NAD-dependent epimerase/dehydratase family protein [Myxococcales bacterium]